MPDMPKLLVLISTDLRSRHELAEVFMILIGSICTRGCFDLTAKSKAFHLPIKHVLAAWLDASKLVASAMQERKRHRDTVWSRPFRPSALWKGSTGYSTNQIERLLPRFLGHAKAALEIQQGNDLANIEWRRLFNAERTDDGNITHNRQMSAILMQSGNLIRHYPRMPKRSP
jgi:hypothetical protein